MASENINPGWARAEGLANAKKLIDEIDDDLPRVQGMDGKPIVSDKQTQRIIRVLRILTAHIEELDGADNEGGGDDDYGMDGGGIQVFDPEDRPWER